MSDSQYPLQKYDRDDGADVPGGTLRTELVAGACLVIVNGPTPGRVFPLLKSETIIGRSSRADVRLDTKAISTQHAKVVSKNGEHTLIDLGSTNGTFLNGQRLSPDDPTVLSVGDSIQVAETVLAYLVNQGRAAEQTQELTRIQPQLPGSTALRLPDAQLLAQLLQPEPTTAEPPAPTLEERIEQLKRLWRIVRRNWVPLFVAAMLCAAIGNITVFLEPPPAEAEVKLRILPSQIGQQAPTSDEVMLFYESLEQDFVSPTLIEGTLKALGPPSPNQKAIDTAARKLKIFGISQSTYRAIFIDKNPQYAVKFLDTHIQAFMTEQIRKTLHVVQTEVNFLTARLAERETELKTIEEALREFKGKHMEGLPEYAGGQVQAREGLMARRSDLAVQLERTELELTLAKKRLSEESPLLTQKVTAAQPYEQSLVEVNRKLGEARGKGFGDQHPEVQALLAQQREFRRLADQARATEATDLERSANPGLLDLRNRVADLEVAAKANRAAMGEVGAQLSRVEGIVGKMPEVEARYADLTRSYAATKDQFTAIFQQLRKSQLQLELERTAARARYEILSPPRSAGIQLRKILFKRTALGLAIGLVIGAVFAALSELRRYLRERRAVSTAIVRVKPDGLT